MTSDPSDGQIVKLVRAFEAAIAEGEALLTNEPALLDRRTSLGETPLHLLCMGPCHDAVRALIALGADVNTVSFCGSTPLADAALKGDLVLVELLLQAGARIAVAGQIELPLHSAVRSGDAPTVKRLLEAGAITGERSQWNDTPLHMAAEDDAAEIAALLVAHGADPADRNGFNETAIDIARTSSSHRCLALLTRTR